jgi:signal peptidase I
VRRRYVYRFAAWLGAGIFGSLLVGALVLALCLGYWRLHGQQVVSVESNSMQPTFNKGDALLVESKPVHALRTGQVISFTDPRTHAVSISHRLVAIDAAADRFTTQGDATNQPDPVLSGQDITGQAVAVLPAFGTVLQQARSPLGLALSVYVPCAFLAYREILRALQAWPQKPYTVASQRRLRTGH